MTSRPRGGRTRAAAATAALLITLTACGAGTAEESGPATDAYAELEGELEGMPGIAEATVAADWLDEDVWDDRVDVAIEEDATAAQVAGALDRVDDGFAITVRFDGDDEDDLDAPVLEAHGSRQVLEEQAAQFLSAAAKFPDAYVEVDTAGVGLLFTTGRDDPAPVTRAARDLVDDPAMAEASIEIRSSSAGREGFMLASPHGIGRALLQAWERSVAAFDKLPGDAYAPQIWLVQQRAGNPKSGIGPARTVTARVLFGATAPTPARHGHLLRPVVRALVDGVLPKGSPGELQLRTADQLILGVTTDGSAASERGTPAWQAWAAEQL